MAVNYAVYSNRIKGFSPFYYDNDIYIYADSTNIVVVCIDCLQDYDFKFTDKAWDKYRKMLNQAYQVRNPQTWGNARFIANQLGNIYTSSKLL